MALGMEMGLDPGHIVLDGNPAPLPKKGAERISIVAKRLYVSGYHIGGWCQPRRYCVRWGPSSPPLKVHSPQLWANVRFGHNP